MKLICVPISKAAQHRLDLDTCLPTDLIELSVSQSDFGLLFSSGWISEVNHTLNKVVGDYEDEHILDRHELNKLSAISERYFDDTQADIFKSIADLARSAEQLQTGLHFYF